MCLIAFSYKEHPVYKLILLSNRDEFYSRATAPAHFQGDLIAGRDLQGGGTWLGVSRKERFAAVTNFREPTLGEKARKSRGLLINDFLASDCSAEHFIAKITPYKEDYSPFNLLLYDGQSLLCYSSKENKTVEVKPGIHALSNHQLNSNWPKVSRIKKSLSRLLNKNSACHSKDLMAIMGDTAVVDDSQLPKTGVSIEWERALSPIFIKGAEYGTRSTAILKIDYQNNVRFIEKTHYANKESNITCSESFRFYKQAVTTLSSDRP